MRGCWLATLAVLTFSSLSYAQEDPAGGGAVGVDTAADFEGDGVDAGGDLPVAYVQRPLTLPEMTLAPEASFVGTHLDVGGGGYNAFFVTAGASFGITDDIMVEAIPLSIIFGDPELDYAFFMGGITARFLEGDFEMGGRFRFIIDNGANLGFNLGLPMRLHADIVRLDTGVHTVITVPTDSGPAGLGASANDDPRVALADFNKNYFVPDPGIPAKVSIQIVEQAWAGLGTGFGIIDFGNAGDTIFVPLQLHGGGTIPTDDGKPLVDIEGGFSFPTFINSAPGDTVVTEIWQFGVVGTGYLDL